MKNISLSLVLGILALFFVQTSVAQDKDWRPIAPEDISSKTPVVDPDADAEAIFWEVRIDDTDSLDLSMKHYVRVKIFTERGREKYSKFDIPFTKGLKIKDLAARVIKTDGSIVEIKKDDIFEREIVKTNGLKIKAKSFAVPNIEPGVIVEYRYKEVLEYAGATGRRLEFQRDIPVRSLTYYYKPYEGREPVYNVYNFKDTKFIKDKNGYYVASKANVPAFKDEPRTPPEDMVRPWIRLGSGFSFSGVMEKAALVRFMKDAVGGDVKKTAMQITEGAATDEEKIARLYAFCQTQIANTTFDPSITDEMRAKLPKIESIKDVLKRKAAPSPFIDMLFGAMALSLKLDARIAYIGDRSKMFIDPDLRSEDFLHPGAIAIKVDGNWKFYNPGTKFLPIGQLVWYEEANWAEVITEDKYEWVKTPFTDHGASATKRTGKFKLGEDGTLEGTVTVEMNGQTAVDYRMDNYDEPSAKLEQNLTDDVKRTIAAAEVSGISIQNLVDPAKPLVETYTVKIPNYAQKTGKRLFVQPNVFAYGEQPAFSSATRKYDIFFRYPWSENDTIEITWPTGYDLDSADTPRVIGDAQKIGRLDISMGADKPSRVLVYKRKFFFGGGGNVLFPSTSYTALKNMFDSFHTADAHTITLKQN